MYILHTTELKHDNFSPVVDVGFVQSVYTSSERDMSTSVCIKVKQGTLGIPVDLLLTTRSGSAQGTHTMSCSYIKL